MYLIVGLGNPGAEYERTRHNLGFMLINRLADESNAIVKRSECQSLIGNAVIENEPALLAKPQTFMNLSGDAVGCLTRKYEIETDSLIVISDDLALPFGSIRLRERGSAGGHNGLKSIIGASGTNEFTRLRIGIQPEHPINDAKRFVLDEFTRAEKESLPKLLERAAEALRAVLRDGVAKAMSRFNSEGQRAKDKEPESINT
ncbi:MAG TPA: aminoacyl-tRNA hydrolase [Pyrinomonadaceae bacterium]|jgi:PTH1 family peptidyl-tRNA hydrolase|nr:aminoacyl-tRNA hydrolase [Pyrinomonadaceae bacterium]